MKPGSVLVDLAVERGGNVEGAVAGQVVTTANDAKIVGHLNVPGRIAATASQLYAKNLVAFLETMIDKETKSLSINFEDELVKATVLTHGGKVVHPAFAGAEAEVKAETVAPVKEKAAAPKAAARKTTTKKPAASKAKSTLSGGEA